MSMAVGKKFDGGIQRDVSEQNPTTLMMTLSDLGVADKLEMSSSATEPNPSPLYKHL